MKKRRATARLVLASLAIVVSDPASAQSGICLELRQKLAPPDLMVGDQFGVSAALDGDVLAIGARGKGPQQRGGVYVFRNEATVWVQEDCLVGSQTFPGDAIGDTIAMSGETIVVGFHRKFHIFEEVGIAYVFAHDGTTWTEQAVLTPPNWQFEGWFGYSVAIQGDLLAIGAPRTSFPEDEQGIVEVFRRSGNQWNHTATLAAEDGAAFDGFGGSVAVDGDLIVVGAEDTDDACSGDPGCASGAVYVFEWTGSEWVERTKLTASDAEKADRLGSSVAIRGSVVATGAPRDDDVAPDSGAVYIFRRSGAVWHEEQKLVPADGAFGSGTFGSQIALDGQMLLVSSCSDDWKACSGAAYVYREEGGAWPVLMKMIPPQTTGFYGTGLVVQGDTICVGAVGESNVAINAGAAYVYDLSQATISPTIYCTAKINSCGTLPAIRLSGIPSATSGGGLFVNASATRAGKAGLLLYTDGGRGNLPFQGGRLCIDPANLHRSLPVVDSTGTAGCNGELSIDMNAFAAGTLGGTPQPYLLVPGTQINAQYWGRDNVAHGSLLSDGIEYAICP